MKSFSIIAALAACTVSLNIATVANALEKSNPDRNCSGGGTLSDGCGQNGGGGPGDPSLEPSKMPPGGDAAGEAAAERAEKAAERRRKEAERKKREAEAAQPHAKSLGRVNTSLAPGPQRSICDAARDARARNSPAAPNLEAQCRASRP